MSNIGQIEAYSRTDTGMLRDHNEDFIDAWEPTNRDEEIKNGWLYIVADGVGGADAGEVASRYASERTISHYLKSGNESDWGARLINAMQAANSDLRQFVLEKHDNSRMATTMVAVVIYDDQAYIGNVGDSRGYIYADGVLTQVTRDQSLVAKLVEEGAITEEEANIHPRRNVILYSLGSERTPKIDLFEQKLTPGTILILCSDGLTRHVSDEEIEALITTEEPEKATETLISLANSRGGEDNISVAVIQYRPDTAVTPPQKTKKMAATPRKQPTVASTSVSPAPTVDNRPLLWLYTVALSLLQSLLIFLAWLLLRV